MCCDSCPRFMNCENDGSLSDLCCKTCSEYTVCHTDSEQEGDEPEELIG